MSRPQTNPRYVWSWYIRVGFWTTGRPARETRFFIGDKLEAFEELKAEVEEDFGIQPIDFWRPHLADLQGHPVNLMVVKGRTAQERRRYQVEQGMCSILYNDGREIRDQHSEEWKEAQYEISRQRQQQEQGQC